MSLTGQLLRIPLNIRTGSRMFSSTEFWLFETGNSWTMLPRERALSVESDRDRYLHEDFTVDRTPSSRSPCEFLFGERVGPILARLTARTRAFPGRLLVKVR